MKMILDLILWNNLVLFEDFTVCTIVVDGAPIEVMWHHDISHLAAWKHQGYFV
jgi:hypothetical protein